jgi:hypothetical protein
MIVLIIVGEAIGPHYLAPIAIVVGLLVCGRLRWFARLLPPEKASDSALGEPLRTDNWLPRPPSPVRRLGELLSGPRNECRATDLDNCLRLK